MRTEVAYKDVPGFPGYRVGSDGSVWSRVNNRWGLTGEWHRLKGATLRRRGGYLKVSLKANGVTSQKCIHQIVLLTFVGPCPDGHECRHLDGNPRNNSVDNLAWGTPLENGADRMKHGKFFTPFAKPSSIDAEKRKTIRDRHRAGESTRTIAASLGLSKTTAWMIVVRKAPYED